MCSKRVTEFGKLVIVMFFLLATISLYSQFAGGTGTEEDPWLIETADHLSNVNNYLGEDNADKHYLQIADIDLGTSEWVDGEGWLPIGNVNSKFFGNYDGDGYSVHNLFVNRPQLNNAGLFGFCMEATIKNLSVVNVDVTGNRWVGGLVGDITGSDEQAGLVLNCSSSGVVNGFDRVGGLAGFVLRSEVNRSSSTADVRSSDSEESATGGLIGFVSTNGIIRNSYARGSVTALNDGPRNGGLIGKLVSASVQYCYSTGTVQGTVGTGGLIGFSEESAVAVSHWDTETSGLITSAGGSGRITEEMIYPYAENSYEGWDFSEIWAADVSHQANDGYPHLSRPRNVPFAAVNPYPEDGADELFLTLRLEWEVILDAESSNLPTGFKLSLGSDSPPTNILFEHDLGWQLSYESVGQLDLNTTYYWQVIPYNEFGEPEDNPIWTFSTYNPGEYHFAGGLGIEEDPWQIETAEHLNNVRYYLEPNRHYIQIADIDLDISPWNEDQGWLPIGNSTDSAFRGSYDGNSHQISKLFIERPDADYQGLFGVVTGGTISELGVTEVNIRGFTRVGALAGSLLSEATVVYCYSSGELTAFSNIGGLIGDNINSTIDNCFSRVEVTGNELVGGLLGNSYQGAVMHSYSFGRVLGIVNTGGLVGRRTAVGDQDINNYWDVDTSGRVSSAMGTGRTTEQMTYPYSEDTYEDWNFRDIWFADIDLEHNGGYPYLQDQITVSIDESLVKSPLINSVENYPNPFNPETTISFNVVEAGQVSLTIHNIKGQKLVTLYDDFAQSGSHRIIWNGKDSRGRKLPSGVYLYRLKTGNEVTTRKMMMLK